MSGHDFRVPPRGWSDIEEIAHGLRDELGLANEPHFPIMDVLEVVLDQKLNVVRFEVGDPDEMGDAEGYTDPRGKFIRLREDVYKSALMEDGRARFTASHELGHFILHTNMPLARLRSRDEVPAYSQSEPQANQFAAAILMPQTFFNADDDFRSVSKRHGVSYEAANHRLNYLRKQGLI